jgi:hypothetical protein
LRLKNDLDVLVSTPKSIFLRAPCVHGLSTTSLRKPVRNAG